MGPTGENVILRDEASHAQGGCDVSASVPCCARMAENVMDRDMKIALRPQHELVAVVDQGNVPSNMSKTKGNTCRASGIMKNPHSFAARNEK